MKKKLNLAILCGGKSEEHNISLLSAINVINCLDQNQYNLFLIGISKEGEWHAYPVKKAFLNQGDANTVCLTNALYPVTLTYGSPTGYMLNLNSKKKQRLDIIFPVLHGPNGEDGSIQGLIKANNIPFVGADVLGSAVGMDKDVMKRLLREAKIPTAKFLTFNKIELEMISFSKIKKELGLPCFVKPANMGSSVGIAKVTKESEFLPAVKDAFKYDSKILIEEGIIGREIECAILGNDHPQASIPGEITLAKNHFYSYYAKYIDDTIATLHVPAENLSKELIKQIQDIAIKTYQVLCCRGFARVDLFLTPKQKVIVNEINTIPGFTNISMYPKMWEKTGLSQPELMDKLIALALE